MESTEACSSLQKLRTIILQCEGIVITESNILILSYFWQNWSRSLSGLDMLYIWGVISTLLKKVAYFSHLRKKDWLMALTFPLTPWKVFYGLLNQILVTSCRLHRAIHLSLQIRQFSLVRTYFTGRGESSNLCLALNLPNPPQLCSDRRALSMTSCKGAEYR